MYNKIVETLDKSNSIYSEQFNETYHSINGAISESEHIYINLGLKYILYNNNSINNKKDKKINIFEMGFGTGLNVLLTIAELEKYNLKTSQNLNIDYYTCEKYPLKDEIISTLNYPELISIPNIDVNILFNKIHKNDWNKWNKINSNFKLYKFQGDIKDIDLFDMSESFEIVYFDAFSPGVQPDLWEEAILQKMYNILSDQGVLVTYCAKNKFKKLLRDIGFTVNNYPGPLGKREVTAAVK
ncbi:MAG: tRNA (5-methylaminomethyl-2-thiouridine)(34)-methyltransferase MnmD [Bacteroidales bacterium]